MHKSPRNKHSYQSNMGGETNLYSPNHHRSHTNSQSVKSLGKSILPSERIIFKELVQELGIEDQNEFRKIKATLKQKYSKHLSLLQGHTLNLQRFRHSQRKQLDSQKKRLEEMKTDIQYKQSRALERKQKQQKTLLSKYENQQQKWKQIIDKNKQQYLRNIKNSMKLIKRWENKLIVSSNKKSQQLNKIIVHAHDHNTYVQDICQRSRLIEDEVNQERIMQLEKKLSLKTELNQPRSMSKRSLKSHKNYDLSTPKKLASERNRDNQNLNRSRTLGPEKHIQNSQNNKKIKIERQTDSRNLKNPQSEQKRFDSSSSNQQLVVKTYLDQAEFEEKVEKSYLKEKRISDARMVKEYMNRQKLKQNKIKQQQLKDKIQQNISKMKEEQEQKNRKLNEKFNEDRRKSRFISNSPKDFQIQEGQRSFPVLSSKQGLFQIQDGFNKKYQKKNSHSVKVNKLDFDYTALSPGHKNQGNIYVTDLQNRQDKQVNKKSIKPGIKKSRAQKRKYRQEMNQKYNKKILQKLRSISLIANIKQKQLLQNQQSNA